MERLTHKRKNGIKRGYWSPNKKQELVDRLAMYEDREDAKDTNVPGEWIPYSERLPELNVPVLTQWGVYYSGEIRIEILYLNELGRWNGDLGEPNGKVIAWMPLPTPYEKENNMDKTYAPIENKPHEKIKVESIDIVVTGPKEKPYYAIKYRKVGSNDDCIGYGSYSPENVIGWKEQCFELVERKSDWIPISERLPDTDEYVLLSFENYTMAAIGRYEENDEGGTFYPGDDEKSYSSYGIFVNAWMPLPEPYREDDD